MEKKRDTSLLYFTKIIATSFFGHSSHYFIFFYFHYLPLFNKKSLMAPQKSLISLTFVYKKFTHNITSFFLIKIFTNLLLKFMLD